MPDDLEQTNWYAKVSASAIKKQSQEIERLERRVEAWRESAWLQVDECRKVTREVERLRSELFRQEEAHNKTVVKLACEAAKAEDYRATLEALKTTTRGSNARTVEITLAKYPKSGA